MLAPFVECMNSGQMKDYLKKIKHIIFLLSATYHKNANVL